jgi:hypothetical protein
MTTLRGTIVENVRDGGSEDGCLPGRDGSARLGSGHAFQGGLEWKGSRQGLCRERVCRILPPLGVVDEHTKGDVVSDCRWLGVHKVRD